MLKEFGLEIPDDVEIRVWDSNADLPERPSGTESLSEAALADLVTRNAMIGTEKVQSPKPPSTLAA